MEQVKSFCRRYRRLLLAAAYLAIFAVGVLYLRVTVNIPPEGDDKLTLNLWLYDFQRMPFWQYASSIACWSEGAQPNIFRYARKKLE